MNKLNKKNLFVELNDNYFIVAIGEYDEELNFKIIDKEVFLPSGFQNGKIVNLDLCRDNIKKMINKIEHRSNLFFSDVNVITNQTDFDCINICGFKKLNGNQILSEDISYILNDIKTKLIETEKKKSIIHLFNSQYLLDNKIIKNLPIGLYGDFYSHQLTFFILNNNDLKNIKALFNKCNLSTKKIVLKSFVEGIKISNSEKKDTFIKIKINKNNTQLIFFKNLAFSFYQKFNFGSDIILKDISKVCSLEISNVRNIISDTNFELSDNNNYIEKRFFSENKFRKVSIKHLIEISSARIEEMIKIVFNQNKNLYNLDNNEITLFLDFEDNNIKNKFKGIFQNYLDKYKLNFEDTNDQDPLVSIEICGELLSKGWVKEAIPVFTKKKSWISRIFSGLFE